MRRLLTVFALVFMICMAWIAPAMSLQNSMPTIGTLFGYERPDKEDVVYFRNNDVLRGTVIDEFITIATAYGDVKVAVRKCAGISFEGSTANTEAVVTVNFNRYTGIIGNRIIRFRIGSSGEVIEVRKEKIKYIMLKRAPDELGFIAEGAKTNLFVMTNGDLITGKASPAQIVIRTDYADVKVSFDEIKEIVMQGGTQPTVQITKKNNDIMRGGLVTEEITLIMDAGTNIEAVYKDKFSKVYVDDGNNQAMALFGNAVTLIGTPSPIVTLPSGAQEIALAIPGPDQVQLKMRLIPAGTFVMGSPSNEVDRGSDEGPQHQVTISRAFYMGIYEVTQAQWAAVMGTYPSKFGYVPANPVEQVSWEDCQKFITKLNTLGIGTFRLPTEAEWEYACRAGSTTRFPWGDDPGYSTLGQYAWYSANSNSTTHFVGQKKPNTWGLYDMHGNVWEWCSDWYAASYGIDKVTDPKGPATGSHRVIRGGCWSLSPQYCRPALRNDDAPSDAFSGLGFRLVRTFQ